jgi:cytoskeleton protein RodZ
MAPDTPPRAEPQASLTPSAGPTLAAAQNPVPPDPAAVAPAADLAGEALDGQAAIPAIAVAAEADPTTGQGLEPPEVEPARGPRAYGTPSPESRVVLRARDHAWVHVSSAHNDYLWVQTLRPGDTFVVPARPDLVLWTGNAGGVEVLVDGALLPPLGPDAVVVRDVSLQPRALLRRLLPLPAEGGGVSDLASAAKPPMMPPSSR